VVLIVHNDQLNAGHIQAGKHGQVGAVGHPHQTQVTQHGDTGDVRVAGSLDGPTELLERPAGGTLCGGGGGRQRDVLGVYASDVRGAVGAVQGDDGARDEGDVAGERR